MDAQGSLWEDLPVQENRNLSFKPIRTPVWTENKAKLIAKYLFYFVLITKHGIYIDGFAAPQEPDREGSWAAKLVLESEPKFLKEFWLCDLESQRTKWLDQLRSAQPTKPKRRIEVLTGDFNALVSTVLSAGTITEKKATFCLLDQRTFECSWSTVRSLAEHKSANKIEIFYFLGTGWLDRALAALKVNKHQADSWWGRPDWQSLQGMDGNRRAQIFCDRFRDELGYTYAHAWPIFDRGSHGTIMYHMIHATDHPEAPKIMARAYRNATKAPEPIEQLELELAQLVSEAGTVEIVE